MNPIKFAFLGLLLLTTQPLLSATEEVYNSGQVGSRWLNVPASARVAGLGGAFAAQGAELGAMEINPAGLAGIENWQASFTHNIWVDGITVERMAGAVHLRGIGTVAANFDYLSLGQVEGVDINGAGQPVPGATLYPTSTAFGGAWGGSFGHLKLGAGIQGFNESLDGSSIYGFQGSAGARWVEGSGSRIGLAVQNISLDNSTSLRPIRVRTGAGFTMGSVKPLALDFNADFQPYDHENTVLRGGGEWAAADSFMIRAGYVIASANQPSGPTAGIGWLAGIMEVDYAAYGVGELGWSHLFTLRLVP